MRSTLIIFVLTVLFSFSLNAQTNKTQQKPVKFDIHKTTANLEKISNQNLEILFKGQIVETFLSSLRYLSTTSVGSLVYLAIISKYL